MSVTAVPLQPLGKGTIAKLWIGLLVVVLLGIGLAWIGTSGQQIITTESGLRYRVIEAGEGPTVTPADLVGLDLEGRLPDGTVFASSAQSGQPTVVSADGLIPGMREAVLMMREGGIYQLWLPANLGYGASPPPGSPIPPNAELEFRVRVIGILEGMAAMQSMMGPGGPGGGPGGPGGAPGGPLDGPMGPGGPGGPGGGPATGPGGPQGAPPGPSRQ
jgi:FKBP-type peptidyl-prolyl cis-trans isomerase FkpA